jgi:hypothetical protein
MLPICMHGLRCRKVWPTHSLREPIELLNSELRNSEILMIGIPGEILLSWSMTGCVHIEKRVLSKTRLESTLSLNCGTVCPRPLLVPKDRHLLSSIPCRTRLTQLELTFGVVFSDQVGNVQVLANIKHSAACFDNLVEVLDGRCEFLLEIAQKQNRFRWIKTTNVTYHSLRLKICLLFLKKRQKNSLFFHLVYFSHPTV